MADLRISELPVLLPADAEASDDLAVADYSSSETRRITTKGLVEEGVSRLIDDGVIPGAKLVDDSVTALQIAPDAITANELADNAVDTAAIQDDAVTQAKLADDSVGTDQIIANAVTDSELADNAVDTTAIQDLAVTDVKVASGINGTKIADNTLTAAEISPAALDRGIDKTSGAVGHTNAVTAATMSGITYDEHGHVTSTTSLVSSDLPPATVTDIGAVSIPTDSGLTVTAAGVLDHENNVTAATVSGITYDEHGHISSAAPLAGTDLPPATDLALGAVIVPGPVLEVSGNGEITHGDSTVAPGEYPKVTVDQKGHVTSGTSLVRADIPALDASILTTGTLDADRYADFSITRGKLADYAITYIQEATPPTTGVSIGTLWFQESTAGLHMWNGNSWMPISIGRLSQENLRYCGTIDASTGIITGVTTFGVSAGYSIGDSLQNATDQATGVYFVVSAPGNGISQTPGVTYDNGDWVLCNGAAAGWVRIDTLNGGGGGGSTNLGDLLDVTLTAPVQDQILQYSSSGQWVNVTGLDEGLYG